MVARGVTGFLALLLVATPLTAQEGRPFVELLLDVRLNRGPNNIVLALADDTTMLLGTLAFTELAAVRVTDIGPGRHLRGVLEPEGRVFWFDTDSGVVHLDDVAIPLPPASAVWRNRELYVATPILERVFDVVFSVNRFELTALVLHTEHLPSVRRIVRARRRERLARLLRAPPPALDVSPPRRLADGAVLDWALTSLTEDPLDASSLELGLGAQVVGGSAVVEHTERRTALGAARETRASWIRAWPGPRVRQVRLGDVLGSGRGPRLMRGAVVTNTPFLRPAAFATAPLYGAFNAGWEVELRRNGRLLGFTTADRSGRFRFDLPIQYGPNPVELIGFGPRGEVIRRESTFEIARLRLPGGQFEYGVGAGRCEFDPCEAMLNADLRYGVTSRLTVQGGVDRFWRDTLPDLWHPYAAVTGQPSRALALTAEAVANGLVGGRIDLAPTPDIQAGVGHTRFDNDVTAPLVGSSATRHRTDAFAFFRPGLMDDQLFFTFTGLHSAGRTRNRQLLRLIATTRALGARFDWGGRYDAAWAPGSARDASVGFEGRFFYVYTGPYRALRRTLFQGELRVAGDSGLTTARFAVSRPFRNALQVDLGADWQRGTGLTIELGITATLQALRAVSRNRLDPDGSVSGTQIAEGSLLWERRGRRIEFSDGRSLGRAGLTGQVFVDLNGNGSADPEEPPIPGIQVQVGALVVSTDSSGRFAVWDLVPFELLVVEIDTLSARDPLWIPLVTRFTFRPNPNSFTPLPLPFVQAGEVTGRVVIDSTGAAVGGAEVLLRNVDTGDLYRATTFSDGTFYVLGVRPGDYEAEVTPDLLEAISATADPARFTIGRRRAEVIVEGIEIRLKR